MITSYSGLLSPISKFRAYFDGLVQVFGLNTLIFLASSYAGLKGLTDHLVSNITLPYLKSLNYGGDQYQLFNILSSLPWSMKSSIGLLSDVCPLYGYHKRSYIVLFTILGASSLCTLAIYSTVLPALSSAVFFALFRLQVAAVDLLSEGKYAELIVQHPETGSSMVTFVQSVYAAGGVAASILTAPLLMIPPTYVFIIVAFLSAYILYPTIFQFPETRLPPSESHVRLDKLRKHANIATLSISLTIGSLILAVVTILSPEYEPVTSLVISIVLAFASVLCLPRTLRNANLYLFINNALYVPVYGATDYFFTADEKCVPNGPNFSLPFYVSFKAGVSQAAFLLGAVLFQAYFSRSHFRTAVAITNIIKICTVIPDVILVLRLNRLLHIPDGLLFLLGDAVIYHVAYRLELIPLILLNSKVCPPGIEASVFAFLVSFQNLGGTVGRSMGYALMDLLNIQTLVPCNFKNLPWLIIIARVILPALSFPLIFWLIPNARITDDLIDEDQNQPENTIQVNDESTHLQRSRPYTYET